VLPRPENGPCQKLGLRAVVQTAHRNALLKLLRHLHLLDLGAGGLDCALHVVDFVFLAARVLVVVLLVLAHVTPAHLSVLLHELLLELEEQFVVDDGVGLN